jgi:hypothetical protein
MAEARSKAREALSRDANGAIADDLRCARCGYNLRGLRPEGCCPECALRIGRSIAAAHRRPIWTKTQVAVSIAASGVSLLLPLVNLTIRPIHLEQATAFAAFAVLWFFLGLFWLACLLTVVWRERFRLLCIVILILAILVSISGVIFNYVAWCVAWSDV